MAASLWVIVLSLVFAEPARGETVVRMSGTGTSLGMLERLRDGFQRANPGVGVQVLPNLGSSGAIDAVASGALDVAISGRRLKEAERALGLAEFEIARTPFVFAAGPRVPVQGIGSAELVQIYRGERTAWPDGARIRLILRPRTDADTILLREISPEMAAAVDAALERPGMLMAVTNQECNEMLERTPGAIAPTTLMQLRAEPRSISALRWNGVEPTVDNMAAGKYPLAKPLYVVLRRSSAPHVRRWLDFVRSAEGRKIVEGLGGSLAPLSH